MLPYIITGILCLLAGMLVIGIPIGIQIRKRIAEKEISSAEDEAKRIINESIKSAESKKREALVEAKEEILKALYTASGIGAVISFRACIAGAAGGCQAEIGSASAMAAGALASLRGGDCKQIGHAAAMALKNLMGLVCDPVAGLVEVPCVKRNVVGAVNAVSCADMALAGIESRIPVDEVIDCMGEVGTRMPMELRETALGGLAATPTGKAIKERMEQEN